jgi:hypothetical protein
LHVVLGLFYLQQNLVLGRAFRLDPDFDEQRFIFFAKYQNASFDFI